ncbi:MAG: Hpt domain-containing protein [Ruthenibacterium sp.]
MNDFMTRLTAYGANVSEAMERLLDDTELYESCVTAFMKDAGFAALKNAIAAADYQDAFEQAHMLKGVAANLSLTPLLLKISELVEALRANNYTALDAQYAAVMREQNKLQMLLQ